MTTGRPPLLLYLTTGCDLHRMAVGPAIARAAERAGWGFELYVALPRRGRHFGGGAPRADGSAHGPGLAGGRHAERVLWLAGAWRVAAVGDETSPLWPALAAAGADVLAATSDPALIYAAVMERLGSDVPPLVRVLDATPQGPEGVVAAPYLAPALLDGEEALGLDVSAAPELRAALERMGVRSFAGLGVDVDRAAAFPGGLDEAATMPVAEGYAGFTMAAAQRHRHWARGVLLGDPELVASQLPKMRRLRLLPLYGKPQTTLIDAMQADIRRVADPVWGRQYDDRDFLALTECGRTFQLLDPAPPFDAASVAGEPAVSRSAAAEPPEPSDERLRAWAEEGRVLITLLLWCGMVREVDCLPALFDLVADTGVRAGLPLTAPALEHAEPHHLALLGTAPQHGGTLGLLEPMLGSAGSGVAFEGMLDPANLAAGLAEALATFRRRLPAPVRPRGWWPILDTPLVGHRRRLIALRGRRPVVPFTPRLDPPGTRGIAVPGRAPARSSLRTLAGRLARATPAQRLLVERRPFENRRPGPLVPAIADAVMSSGLEYMWTKASFGAPRVAWRDGDFVALPLTAGAWDGWTPFYTLGGAGGLARAERRLLRSGPGWLAANVDTTLFALPGEVWEHGPRLRELVAVAAAGGHSGRLVNVTPNVVARYARILHERGSD